MKAQLRIGNEMREGELSFYPIREDSFLWMFQSEEYSGFKVFSQEGFVENSSFIAHFKSIGGIIIQDEKGD